MFKYRNEDKNISLSFKKHLDLASKMLVRPNKGAHFETKSHPKAEMVDALELAPNFKSFSHEKRKIEAFHFRYTGLVL